MWSWTTEDETTKAVSPQSPSRPTVSKGVTKHADNDTLCQEGIPPGGPPHAACWDEGRERKVCTVSQEFSLPLE